MRLFKPNETVPSVQIIDERTLSKLSKIREEDETENISTSLSKSSKENLGLSSRTDYEFLRWVYYSKQKTHFVNKLISIKMNFIKLLYFHGSGNRQTPALARFNFLGIKPYLFEWNQLYFNFDILFFHFFLFSKKYFA